jgi:hypothetical protein
MNELTNEEILTFVNKLMQKPKNKLRFTYDSLKNVLQIDLLHMPTDGKYKYILVVYDMQTHEIDAEAIISKTSKETVKAFIKILDRKIIHTPKIIYSDRGTEFKADFINYCTSNNMRIRYLETGQHAHGVENANKRISGYLFKIMNAESIKNSDVNSEWNINLRTCIDDLNSKLTYKPKVVDVNNDSVKTKDGKTETILHEGDKVLSVLERPQDIYRIKFDNKNFRHVDLKYDLLICEVENIIINLNQPVGYKISNHTKLFTSEQLYKLNDRETNFLHTLNLEYVKRKPAENITYKSQDLPKLTNPKPNATIDI